MRSIQRLSIEQSAICFTLTGKIPLLATIGCCDNFSFEANGNAACLGAERGQLGQLVNILAVSLQQSLLATAPAAKTDRTRV